MCTYVSFFPPYVSFPFCRFSIFVFLLFSFIFSYLSRKWRPTLFVLELRHLFLWSSGHSVKKIAKLLKKVWTISEHVVKSKDFGRQTKEWMSVLFLFFFLNGWEMLLKSYKYMALRNNSATQKGKKLQLHNIKVATTMVWGYVTNKGWKALKRKRRRNSCRHGVRRICNFMRDDHPANSCDMNPLSSVLSLTRQHSKFEPSITLDEQRQ